MSESTKSIQASIVRIGNSNGIRIPKPLLEQCGFEHKVTMTVVDGKLILTPLGAPRSGWSEVFCDDAPAPELLIDDSLGNDFDEHEWTW